MSGIVESARKIVEANGLTSKIEIIRGKVEEISLPEGVDKVAGWTGGVFGRVLLIKLDGVGPVDNRPSTDKLHHFVRKKKTKKL